jgi:hypothetical protein
VKNKLSNRTCVLVALVAASLAATAGARAGIRLGDTAWASDLDKDCFVLGLELRANGTAELAASTMDVLSGNWKLSAAISANQGR